MSQIQIYARVRPTSRQFDGIKVHPEDSTLAIHIGEQDNITKRPESRYARAPPSKHMFKFRHVFDQQASQEEVFNRVATHMIDSFLTGYNGTIFAYGQTSSGKTHTIEGSSKRYSDRGLIPRVITAVFEEVERRCGLGQDVSVHVSYMEIYQDTGYDLLNPGMRPGALMVTLPKVQITESSGNEVKVRNLSQHLAASEEVALSLLFQGSTCRKVAETSMNQCSSRSHTIFTIHLTVTSPCKSIITRSKLNLVDLAGSERVAKTRADGRVLQEAKYINLSLHHLEHVIVTLQQLSRQNSSPHVHTNHTSHAHKHSPSHSSSAKTLLSPNSSSESWLHSGVISSPPADRGGGRSHIPYRNSMLTMVLKDSLGGNCLTAMIATISAEEINIWETISTCRFSQRVACISNVAKCNEELDDKVVIKRLKMRIQELETELQSKTSNTSRHEVMVGSDSNRIEYPLSPHDKQLCHSILHQFFHGKIENPVAEGINTASRFHECMQVMRKIVLHSLELKTSNESKEPAVKEKEPKKEPLAPKGSRNVSNTRTHRDKVGHRVGSQRQTVFNVVPAISTSDSLPAHFENSIDFTTPTQLPVHLEEDGQEITPPSNHVAPPPHHSTRSVDIPGCYDNSTTPPQRLGNLEENSSSDSFLSRVRHAKKTERGRMITPLSRHSSGFGSLQDEGSNVTLESADVRHTPVSALPPRHKPRLRERKSNEVTTGRFSKESVDSGQEDLSSRDARRQAWISSIPTPVTSEPSFVPTPTPAWGSPAPQASAGSPHREGGVKGAQALMEKHGIIHQSKLERQRLTKDVQILNLRVTQKQIVNDLCDMKERVAQQIVYAKAMERNGLDTDQINTEKMIEQQLRTKQSKLHQKLVSVTQEIKKLEAGDISGHGPLQSKKQSPISSGNGYASYTRRVKKELDNQQDQLQEDIERLKLVQMERNIKLKEAATKRKILALKQQLLQNQGLDREQPGHRPDHSQTGHIQPSHGQEGPDHSQTGYLQPSEGHVHVSPDHSSAGHMKPNHGQEGHMLPGNNFHKSKPIYSDNVMDMTRPPATNHMTTFVSQVSLSSSQESHLTPSNNHMTSFRDHMTSSSHMSSMTSSHDHVTPLSGHTTSPGHMTHQKTPPSQSIYSNTSQPTSNRMTFSGHKTTPLSTKRTEKLTLPEEMKESEYMTAVQKQKCRVTRIRRCIVAATVIQRAWRRHRAVRTS